MGYEIVRYSPEFRGAVTELQTDLWSPDVAVNEAYLEWKYDRNPYLATPLIHLALHGRRVVGMRGMYGAKWEIGLPGRAFLAPCAGDLVIAPEHRNRGLVGQIIETAADDLVAAGHTYAFSLSASLVTQLSSLTAGWRSVGALETASRRAEQGDLWKRLLARASRLRLVRSSFDSAPRLPGGSRSGIATTQHRPFHRLDSGGVGERLEASKYLVLEQTPRPREMAELVERIGGDGRLRHVRDQAYFAWRFGNPLSVYRFLFWADTRLEGYLVLQAPARAGHTRVSIVDWEAAHARARADLLEAAVRWGEFRALTTWSATLEPEARALLGDAGFRFVEPSGSIGRAYRGEGDHPAILVQAVGRETAEATDWVVGGRRLLDLGNWDLRGIYSDGV